MLANVQRAIISLFSALATLWSLGQIVVAIVTRRDAVTEFFGLGWSFNTSGYSLLAMLGLGVLVSVNLPWLWQLFRPKSSRLADLRPDMERLLGTLASDPAWVALRPEADSVGIANSQRIASMRRKLQKMGIPCPGDFEESVWHQYLSGLVVLAEHRDYRRARSFYQGT